MDQCIINFGGFNWLAVLVAAIVGYALGALWYSPILFAKPWMKLQGFKEEDLKDGWIKAMVITFITTFLTAFVLEAVVATWHLTDWSNAFPITFLFGLFLYGGNQLSDFLYSRRPMKLFWITFMYRFVMILIMSLILILWQ
jgi:hypothetical protein